MTDAELALLPRVELVLEGEVVLSLEPQDYLHEEVGGCVCVCRCCVCVYMCRCVCVCLYV